MEWVGDLSHIEGEIFMSYTATYAILEVSKSTFYDVKRRLKKAGVLADFLEKNVEHGWILVFHTTALAIKKKK